MGGPAFSDSEYESRQSTFFSQLPSDTLLIIPNNPFATRTNDVHYPYRANSYLLYLTGWGEANSVFTAVNIEDKWHTTLFVPGRDVKKEIWEGRRIGPEGAKQSWYVDDARDVEDLESSLKNWMQTCKQVHLIPKLDSGIDVLVNDAVTSKTRARNTSGTGPVSVTDPSQLLDEMRLIKSDAEINKMQIAADIASKAHALAMRETRPGIGEWEIQSCIEGYFLSCKSQWSYPSIVGGGDNATILHYNDNSVEVRDGDLVLVDAGCEVDGYASDITRTWPVNGRFNDAQKEIYELVLQAEIEGIKACVVGAPWNASHYAASRVLAQGLLDLGILEGTLDDALGENWDGPYRNFFMHGTSHSLGLDVHDVGVVKPNPDGAGRPLEAGMVLTVEPGLYFGSWRNDVEVPERYAGIGIRIEDDVLITDDGPVVLTKSCPKSIDELESLIGAR